MAIPHRIWFTLWYPRWKLRKPLVKRWGLVGEDTPGICDGSGPSDEAGIDGYSPDSVKQGEAGRGKSVAKIEMAYEE